MTNLRFLSIRKCYGYEWEAYLNTKSKTYVAICHTISSSVESPTWEGLWDEILTKSKQSRKNQKKKGKGRRSYENRKR